MQPDRKRWDGGRVRDQRVGHPPRVPPANSNNRELDQRHWAVVDERLTLNSASQHAFTSFVQFSPGQGRKEASFGADIAT